MRCINAFYQECNVLYSEGSDWAKDGEEAVQIYKDSNGDYDIILMDCLMPNKDGLQATAEIRQWEASTAVSPASIIAVTANDSEGYERTCMDAGMTGFMAKPVRVGKLQDAISEIIQH